MTKSNLFGSENQTDFFKPKTYLLTKLNLMKRSNFTFLFLFSLLSFVSVQVMAQPASSSCIDKVNITVDENCEFAITPEVLGFTGSGAVSIYFPASGSGIPFPGAGKLGANGLKKGHNQYEIYSGPITSHGPSGMMLCWGHINLEIKKTPDPEIYDWPLMCGQEWPKLPSLADISKAINDPANCYPAITDLYIQESRDNDKCNGNTYTREVYGNVKLDGRSIKVLIRRDNITEMPIDPSDILCPLGETFDTRVKVPCGVGTDPESIMAHFNKTLGAGRGIPYAYPHLYKGLDSTRTITPRDSSFIVDTVQQKIEINGVWVLADVVRKGSVRLFDTTYTTRPIYVPIKKGVQCNLTTKCTDWYFESCVGPEAKIMRNWSILDWCTGTVTECTQWIEVVDNVGPVLASGVRVHNEVEVSIAPWICAAEYTLPRPAATDACSGVTYHYSADAGNIVGGKLVNLWLSECRVTLTVTITDKCGNETYVYYHINIVDKVPPVAIAEDRVNVTLTYDASGLVSKDGGVAKVYVNAIDAGSHDAGCGEVNTCLLLKEEFENQIVDARGNPVLVNGRHIYKAAQCAVDGEYVLTQYDPKTRRDVVIARIPYVFCKEYVKFCCSDIGENVVALVVTDNGDYCKKSYHPNFGYSWSVVNVEDKSGAGWVCFTDDVICTDVDLFNPKKPAFGGVICAGFDVKEVSREVEVQCGEGWIYITYSAHDKSGATVSTTTCRYRVKSAAPFDPFEIKWPKHYDGTVYEGLVRECEDLFEDQVGGFYIGGGRTNPNAKRVTKGGATLKHIVNYVADVKMGDAFECVDGADTGAPTWCDPACALIGVSYIDETIAAADACKKIIRRWTVIDWCTWEPNNTSRDYVFEYKYNANVPDDTNDGFGELFVAIDDEWLGNGEWYNWRTRIETGTSAGTVTYQPCEKCEKSKGTSDHVYFAYAITYIDGYYTFDQVIKVVDDTNPEIVVADKHEVDITNGAKFKGDKFDDCRGSDIITATVSDLCGEVEIGADDASWWIELFRVDGTSEIFVTSKNSVGATATMSTGNGKPGDRHRIKWRVKDGCGNIGVAITDITFADTKKPTPVCIQDLSTAIMANGEVTIWATDYDHGSFDNCGPVKVSFSPTAVVNGYTVKCADLAGGPVVELALYVHDNSGNVDFCYITLRVDDNQGACPDTNTGAAAILGEVRTEAGDMVESAEVSLNTAARNMTSVEGKYAFNVNANADYSVKAKKDNDYMNGVSTLDLVLIQKHVIGLQNLDSPYKVIAADINSDQRITAIDLLELRKLILGIYAELPANDSWRFVAATQTFDEVLNPFPFAEVLNVRNAAGQLRDNDFIAVKIGDVSGNAIANSLLAAGGRSAGTLSLEIADASVKAGQSVEVAVRGNNFADIAGYQFTMEVSGLSFRGVTSGSIEVSNENFGLINANTITTAWYNATGVNANDVLFTLTFEATSDVQLSKAINVTSKVTRAEAYTGGLERLDVQMNFTQDGSIVSASGFSLAQNEPNPFNDVTRVGFTLPEAGRATLTVFDVTGKTLSVIRGEYARGYNEVTLRKADLNASGVLYYQLESGEFTATKKMILMD